MAEYTKPTNEQEFAQNFEQIKPLMNNTQAYYESSRCLFCYDAPCVNACPTAIDIPLFIRQIQSKNVTGAAKTIYDSNYFGNACGKVCPTEVLCEGACVYNLQEVKPIEIGRLQSFATQAVITNNKILYKPETNQSKKIAVIGSGPAGISAACELRSLGYEVTIFEAKENPSGLTIHGVAPYKITNQEILDEMAYLQKQFHYEVKYNSPIKNKEDLKKLEKNYDAIFLGIGLGNTSKIQLKGEDLENVLGATEIIEELRLNHHNTVLKNKIVVLGGGNTAMDAASEAARMGAENVVLAYRRSKEEMPAYDFEYDLAKGVGVKGLFNVAPVEILGNRKVTGIKFIKTEIVNHKVKNIEGSEFIIECDMIIKATGQKKLVEFLSLIDTLELQSNGRIKVNPENAQTTNPKYFAAGDAVNGGAEVVNAAAEGKQAAIGIHLYFGRE